MITQTSNRVRATGQIRSARLQGADAPGARPLVSESWDRSLSASVDPDRAEASEIYTREGLLDARAAHPLAAVIPLLESTLRTATDDGSHVMIVTDACGDVLWRTGSTGALRRSDEVGLVEGSRWAEQVVGTNGMGTALAARVPVQIHATEHLVTRFDAWTCAAAPILDPSTGELLGSIDLSGPARCFHPVTLGLVTASARLAENELKATAARRERPAGRLELRLLGPGSPRAVLGLRNIELTPRQSDLLAVMSMNPDGLSADELTTAVYGECGRVGTVRTQVHRLRAALGAGSISTYPYRIRIPIRSDFLDVREALAQGRVREATKLYRGPLLPISEAPTVREERSWLAAAVRRAALAGGDVEALWVFAQTRDAAEDEEVLELLQQRLPASDPRQVLLRATCSVRHADVG